MSLPDSNWLIQIYMIETSKQRFVSIGKDAIDRVIVVVYTYRGEQISNNDK